MFLNNGIYEEILPLFTSKRDVAEQFAGAVIEHFKNPFIKHQLTDIGLNSTFKYQTRLLRFVKKYQELNKKIPKRMNFSLAAILAYYRSNTFGGKTIIGKIGENTYTIRDREEVLAAIHAGWTQYDNSYQSLEQLKSKLLPNENLWGEDITKIEGLQQTVTQQLQMILMSEMKVALMKLEEMEG